MNFYQMDVDSIERQYRNTDQSIPDVIDKIIALRKKVPILGQGKNCTPDVDKT